MSLDPDLLEAIDADQEDFDRMNAELASLRALNASLVQALREIRSKAHDFDQTGPAGDYRFAELEDLANDALGALSRVSPVKPEGEQ